MNKYYGGEPVAEGMYLNLGNLEFVRVNDEAQILQGDRDNRYIKVPGAMAVVAGPLAGLAFILFLPLVGIAGMVTFLIYKGLKGAQWLGGKMLRTAPAKLEPKAARAQPDGADDKEQGNDPGHYV
ncbi:MAG: hypothetical protein Q7R57_02855 [Dehalococcoidales bacterium]|nr:hypothetical protein [Dehalococcoidales bacterium]